MTKKNILLSLCACTVLGAQETTLEMIIVEGANEMQPTQKDLGIYEVKTTKQMDLAEILSNKMPSINHIRSSGVGSDISIRGFERDNINVTIDGAKVCGACPNRMDPPAMHVSSEQIAKVEVQEGPFDVSNFGAMGGSINVVTQDPQQGFHGSIEAKAGSYGYNKFSVVGTGGNETIQVLVGVSKEESGQYEDGNGDSMVKQVENIAASAKNTYLDDYDDADAFERTSFWSKVNVNLTDNQQLKFSIYKDDADDVLYPVFGMDAQIDKTTMYSIEYLAKNLGWYSNELSIKYYDSEVQHEMGTEFRVESLTSWRTHAVDAEIKGLKLQNKTDHYTYGIDASKRTWDGECESEPNGALLQVRIPDVETKNIAFFGKTDHKFGNLRVNTGIRIDRTDVDANESVIDNAGGANPIINAYYDNEDTHKDYNDWSANATFTYDLGNDSSVFASLGQATRVPDAKELYFIAYGPAPVVPAWKIQGNPDLEPTKNREIDLGFKTQIGETALKTKAFYSDLKDYIYAYKIGPTLTFDNIDAKIYGAEVSMSHALLEDLFLDASVAYQRGKKDHAITGQSDTDLAGIPPLKGRIALELDRGQFYAIAEYLFADDQNYDEDNGEQEISGYGVLNLKGGYTFNKSWEMNMGVNNVFDKVYVVNNSYVGRGLITATGDDPMVMNEPGRNFYINLKYSF